MQEYSVFLIVLIILGVIDIRSMKKASLKKELLPYLVLTAAAVTVGALYMFNPYGESISAIFIRLFGFGK